MGMSTHKIKGEDYYQCRDVKAERDKLLEEVAELLDRLEASEADALEQARLNGMGAERELALMAKLEAAEKERDALQAKVEAMEKQEPTMWVNSSNIISAKINKERRGAGDQHTCSETKTAYHDAPLYALSGAKGE